MKNDEPTKATRQKPWLTIIVHDTEWTRSNRKIRNALLTLIANDWVRAIDIRIEAEKTEPDRRCL